MLPEDRNSEPDETSIARQRLGKLIFLGNGYASNNRRIVGKDIFLLGRCKVVIKEGS
jgi:hypothetical protein